MTDRTWFCIFIISDNTRRWGKYHCTTGPQFYKFGFNCFITYKTAYFLCWSSPFLLNRRPAVNWSFPQRWEFSDDIYVKWMDCAHVGFISFIFVALYLLGNLCPAFLTQALICATPMPYFSANKAGEICSVTTSWTIFSRSSGGTSFAFILNNTIIRLITVLFWLSFID